MRTRCQESVDAFIFNSGYIPRTLWACLDLRLARSVPRGAHSSVYVRPEGMFIWCGGRGRAVVRSPGGRGEMTAARKILICGRRDGAPLSGRASVHLQGLSSRSEEHTSE